VGGWTPELAQELVDRLAKRGRSVQAATLAYEAHHGGYAPRRAVYHLGKFMADRRLNGFTRPVNAVVREMVDEGLLPAGAVNPMEPQYDPARLSFQQAQSFAMGSDPASAAELAEVFAQVLQAPDVPQDLDSPVSLTGVLR
jgi:hypothetical protein